MSYEVRCECGKAHTVGAADAGRTFPCGCGKVVEVPPSHQLRASVGQSGVAPELELRVLLANRELPGTDACASCGKTTGGVVLALIDCESMDRPNDDGEPGGCLGLGLLAILARRAEPPPLRGRDVAFRVPVRCCANCERGLGGDTLRGLLRRHRACAGVLDKYPHARISRAD